ncbi:MAG: hypothetical protein JST55_16790 [Bacteroidetes bacterium]|nr:hypothetical protein [Bacteroidota bacterium]
MLNSNLIKVLSSLSKEELKSFEDFVASPYFNKKPSVVSLFKELKKYYPEFKDEALTKEKIYSKLYKGKAFNDGVLRNQMSELYKLLLKFLGNEAYERDSTEFKIKVSRELLTKGLSKTFKNYYDDIKKDYDKDNLIVNEYYYWDRAVLDEQYEDNILFSSNAMGVPVNNLYGNNLIYFFLIKLFKVMHNLHATEVNTNVYYDKSILREFLSHLNTEEVLNRIKEISEKDYNIVSIYYYMSKALMDYNDHDSFTKFYNLVEKNYLLFAEGERYSLYVQLNNIASHSSVGKAVLLDIYKSMLEKKIYKAGEKGYLNYLLFSYILTNAIYRNELDWLEKFIDEYIPEIDPAYQENMKNYSKGHLYYQRKDYNKSLEHITKVKSDNFMFKHQSYKLIAENYYELNEIEQLYFTLDNFNHYIKKANLPAEWITYYEGYISAVRELVKIKEGKEKDTFKINKCIKESIGDMTWVRRKLTELDFQ